MYIQNIYNVYIIYNSSENARHFTGNYSRGWKEIKIFYILASLWWREFFLIFLYCSIPQADHTLFGDVLFLDYVLWGPFHE